MGNREHFSSRIGFILMTAGCAIGLGNIWRFPYIAGANGGGFFVLLYLFFLAILGFPVLVMELAIGRAGQLTLPGAMKTLHNGKKSGFWKAVGYVLFSGNFFLLMFYSPVTGWLTAYSFYMLDGTLVPASGVAPDYGAFFGSFLDSAARQVIFTIPVLLLTAILCLGGLRKSVEKGIKVMMAGLFLLLVALVVKALAMPGAGKGVEFFLLPKLENMDVPHTVNAIHAAMAQAFFTLSLGVGSVALCGSYIGKNRSLPGDAMWVILLDTLVAIAAGLIIFPCCFEFGVSPDAGPKLIFVTLPQVFDRMPLGRWWGSVFFIFLTIAALSTLVAVFENLVAFGMDNWSWSRRKSSLFFGAALAIFSLPCIFGFNLWKSFEPLGRGTNILDLEDFIVSDNLLPLGALLIALFCIWSFGWGEKNFFAEVNSGNGVRLSRKILPYLRYILPLLVALLWLAGVGIFKIG